MVSRPTLIRLCRARDRLRETGDAGRSIADVAREAGISPYHFIRLFRAVFGETPHQFRIQARLEHAKLLLAAGSHSVTEVCMEIGFASLGTFSDLFARRVGVAPSAYRKRYRTIVTVPELEHHALVPSCFFLMSGQAGAAIFKKHQSVHLAHLRTQPGHLRRSRWP
jgi:AraC-like DNA-binding protein